MNTPCALSRESIERLRSPRDLLTFIESVRAHAQTDAELKMAGHLRAGYAKEFFDEVVPLASFAISAYPENYAVRPILGNQGYDAEVLDANGVLVERVEIANPIDGQAIAATGRQLVADGVSDFRVENPGDDFERILPVLERTAAKKATKDYSDAVVVFNVAACPAYRGFEARHEAQVARVRATLLRAKFRARRVFVLLPSGAVERIDT